MRVLAPDGDVAAYAVFWFDPVSATGLVEPMRTDDSHQRRGLALAGANHRASSGPDEDDGILTAEEIATLDLRDTEWAVLSACDTGSGEIRGAEGVFGLQRAFRLAGARTTIMSLWPVEDEAARVWMTALYRNHFAEGRSTAESAHRASLELLAQRRAAGLSTHPIHWAGFIASGNWR